MYYIGIRNDNLLLNTKIKRSYIAISFGYHLNKRSLSIQNVFTDIMYLFFVLSKGEITNGKWKKS